MNMESELMKVIKITEIEGFNIGNAQNLSAATGCTVTLCKDGASGGVDVRGGAPGTRETDLLNPMNMVDKIHGVLLTGGSAFGLDAAGGVMKYLEEKNCGFDAGVTKVPIVCGAALFDLTVGKHDIRPDAAMGYMACTDSEKNNCSEGNVGAGTGATVGKILGPQYAVKGGLGNFAIQAGNFKIGAVAAVNCLGDVIDSENGEKVGGVLNKDKNQFLSTEEIMISKYDNQKNLFNGNTTIAAVITNASLTKSQANKIASMAHNGMARAIRPAHTMFDGDTIFVMGNGNIDTDISTAGFLAAYVMEKAIIRAVKNTDGLYGYKCYKDIINKR